METLKFEDLMVNDIVLAEAVWYDDETGEERVEWHPFRVTDISSKCCLFCGDIEEGGFIGEWIDDCDAEEMRELRGMPLTEEILKANGFEYDEFIEVLRICTDKPQYYYVSYDSNIERLKIGIDKYRCAFDVDMTVHYVHELQDALRCCKLRKLANNFKIKPA